MAFQKFILAMVIVCLSMSCGSGSENDSAEVVSPTIKTSVATETKVTEVTPTLGSTTTGTPTSSSPLSVAPLDASTSAVTSTPASVLPSNVPVVTETPVSEYGGYDKAINELTEAIKGNPNPAEIHLALGLIYSYIGKFDLAIENYTKAIESEPGTFQTSNNFIEYYDSDEIDALAHSLRGLAYLKTEDYDQVIADTTNTVNIIVDNLEDFQFSNSLQTSHLYEITHLYRGMAYFEKGEYDQAITDYYEALNGYGNLIRKEGQPTPLRGPKPFDDLVRAKLVQAHYEKGEDDEALKNFRSIDIHNLSNNELELAVEISTLGGSLIFNIAEKDVINKFWAINNYEDAVRSYREAMELNADYTEARDGLERSLTKIIDIWSTEPDKPIDHSNAYRERGDFYLSIGEYDSALADFTKAIEISPGYCRLMGNLDRARIAKDTGEVITETRLGTKQDISRCYNSSGLDLFEQAPRANYYDAMNAFDQAIRFDPDFAEAYFNRGRIGFIGSTLVAITADFTKAIELKSDFTEAYYLRGVAYMAQARWESDSENYEHAIADFTQAIELKPGFIEARDSLERARRLTPYIKLLISFQYQNISAIELKEQFLNLFENDNANFSDDESLILGKLAEDIENLDEENLKRVTQEVLNSLQNLREGFDLSGN